MAHRSRAKIFETTARNRLPTLVQEIDHPEGRLQNRELDTDQPGRLFSIASKFMRHGTGPRVDAEDHVARQFAKELVDTLEQAKGQNRFETLILAAEPRFLGILFNSIHGSLKDCLIGTVNKNLINEDVRDLPDRIYGNLKSVGHETRVS